MKRILILFLLSVPLMAVTLTELIDQAMKQSTIIKQSKAQIELMQMKRQESRADQFGKIDLVGSYTHYNLPRTLAPLTPTGISADTAAAVATTKDIYSAAVVYSVPLFTGFAQTRQIEMDALSSSLAQSRLLLTKEQLAYNVASLYLSILALQEMQEAQQTHLNALKKLKENIANEVKLGKKARVDLLKVKKDLYGNISYLEALKGNIEITKASLASLVGINKIGSLQKVNVTVERPHYVIEDMLQKADDLNKIKIADYTVQ